MSDKKVQTKAGATELSEEELDQAQGGGLTQFPAGTGGLDLKKIQPTLQNTSENIPSVDGTKTAGFRDISGNVPG